MTDFLQLKKNLKKDFSSFKKLKVALLGDSATQLLAQGIRGYGYEQQLDLDIYEAEYNQIDGEIADPHSTLYEFAPDFIVLFISSEKLLQRYNSMNVQQRSEFASLQIQRIDSLINTIRSRISAKVIFYNFVEINDFVFGNFSANINFSFIYQLRKLNVMLMESFAQRKGCFLADLSSVQNKIGRSTVFSPSTYVNADMSISIDAIPFFAKCATDIILASQGRIKKCLILDLDNTLWGGIIGDDGIEKIQIGHFGIGKAFTELQQWVKKLKERGIIIAICSKNDEKIAKEPFISHPDMVLRLEDIAVFVANWDNKADNIRHIQKILNIGFDSMVFLDDNPFERNIVKENIPQICVPELPEDPSDYLEYLYSLNLFETTSFSEEDAQRNKQYQIEAQRVQSREKFTNEDDYLKNLQMVSEVSGFNAFNTPRVAQLSQRSNQFNLRTIRYSESDIEAIGKSSDYAPFAFTLDDKYGENGLIAVIILKINSSKELFIETWIMSCRVLKRGMEDFSLNTIMKYAADNGFERVVGEYIPTAKNALVKNHYKDLGFAQKGNEWILETKDYKKRNCYIKTK